MIFYSQILRIVLLLVMTSSYEDIEKKNGIPLHHTFLYTEGTSEKASSSSSKRVHRL